MARIATITAVAAGAALLFIGYQKMNIPRGIRYNNPGNIEKGQNWNGIASTQPAGRYLAFQTPEYGIRAMARILRTYREKHGKQSVHDIIHRWAPDFENPTANYVNFVAGKLDVKPDDTLKFTDARVADLIAAMIHFENGQQPYSRSTLLAGIELERT